VTQVPGNFSNWSADGKHLAYDFFDADGNEQIATVNPDGTGTQQLTSGPAIHESPAFSPDGTQIVYDHSPTQPDAPGFHTTLWIMNVDGSDQHQLVPGSATFDVEPEFSPDAQSLAFIGIRKMVGRNQQNALFVGRADGTERRQLTSWGQSVELGNGAWSPGGQWITYYDSADIGGSRSIYLIRRDGTSKHVVYQGQRTAEGARPSFSPDGAKIMFACITYKPSPDVDLCIMDADGSNVVDITNTRGGANEPTLETRPSWGTAPLL
jgi:Tol biopolymer transport system component